VCNARASLYDARASLSKRQGYLKLLQEPLRAHGGHSLGPLHEAQGALGPRLDCHVQGLPCQLTELPDLISCTQETHRDTRSDRLTSSSQSVCSGRQRSRAGPGETVGTGVPRRTGFLLPPRPPGRGGPSECRLPGLCAPPPLLLLLLLLDVLLLLRLPDADVARGTQRAVLGRVAGCTLPLPGSTVPLPAWAVPVPGCSRLLPGRVLMVWWLGELL